MKLEIVARFAQTTDADAENTARFADHTAGGWKPRRALHKERMQTPKPRRALRAKWFPTRKHGSLCGKDGLRPKLFGTVVANTDEHDSFYHEAVITSGQRCCKGYGEAVVLQSPGSRSAPWVRMDNNVYSEGVAQTACGACHDLCVTPVGVRNHSCREPRVRCATLGFGVKRLRRTLTAGMQRVCRTGLA